MTIPGMQPAGFVTMPGVPIPPLVPKSFVFNGTDEQLARTLATSGASSTIFTYSMWVKMTAYGAGFGDLFSVINAPTNTQYTYAYLDLSGAEIVVEDAVTWLEYAESYTPDIATGVWEHIVIRYDSTQGTADNRLRFYLRGAETPDTTMTLPGASEAHRVFSNGFLHKIGAAQDGGDPPGSKKMAFIDVLEGVSADATAFGFNNGGTWTRKPYVGSRGTYGFSLDGTDLFNDVSGNGQHFTGNNMDATNLDADVPPYVMV